MPGTPAIRGKAISLLRKGSSFPLWQGEWRIPFQGKEDLPPSLTSFLESAAEANKSSRLLSALLYSALCVCDCWKALLASVWLSICEDDGVGIEVLAEPEMQADRQTLPELALTSCSWKAASWGGGGIFTVVLKLRTLVLIIHTVSTILRPRVIVRDIHSPKGRNKPPVQRVACVHPAPSPPQCNQDSHMLPYAHRHRQTDSSCASVRSPQSRRMASTYRG